MRRIAGVFKDALHVLFLGALIGLSISTFGLLFELLGELSIEMHASREPYVILAQIIITLVASFLSYQIVRREPIAEGIEVPHVLMAIRGEEDISGFGRIGAVVGGSFLTAVTAIPLGPEGAGGLLSGQLVVFGQRLDCHNVGNRGEIAMGLSAGFGAAFLAPLSGLIYGFEEGWHHFSWRLLWKGILMCLSAYLVSYAVETAAGMKRIFALEGLIFPGWESFYMLGFLFLLVPPLVYLFSWLFRKLNAYVRLRRDRLLFRLRTPVFFLIVMVMGFLFPYEAVIGSGHALVEHTTGIAIWWSALLFFAVRFLLTIVGGNAGSTGGIVIPSLAMGALLGRLATLLAEEFLGMDPSYSPFWIVFASCFFLATLNKVPLTASTLLGSSLFFMTRDWAGALLAVLISLPVYALACLPLYLHKAEDLYDGLIEIEEEARHLPHLHGVPLEN